VIGGGRGRLCLSKVIIRDLPGGKNSHGVPTGAFWPERVGVERRGETKRSLELSQAALELSETLVFRHPRGGGNTFKKGSRA